MPPPFDAVRRWIAAVRREREARRLLAELFRTPEKLAGTSLRPRHAARWVCLGHDVEAGRIVRIRFGILRHPRPYRFSRQAHKVIELYTYDPDTGRVARQSGINVTRAGGRDAD